MKRQDSWSSGFRKNRFYERQNLKKEKSFFDDYDDIMCRAPKTIAVMLDLDGTTDFIDDQKVRMFVKQLEVLRRKFNAQFVTISISTHYMDSNEIQETLDIIARNLPKNIKIGLNFYYGGIYDYDKKENILKEPHFNSNKAKTFEEYYVTSFGVDNQWFAIVDDNISEDVYKRYQNTHPMLLCRPSQRRYDSTKNCFMSLATETKGFDGVLEMLSTYIDSIKNLSAQQILETQKNMMVHLSSYEVSDKIRKRDYSFIERYFTEGYADDSDYRDALTWIIYTCYHQPLPENEFRQLQHILEIMIEKFHSNQDEQNLERAKILQKSLKETNQNI